MDKETIIILSVLISFILFILRGLRKNYWGICNFILSVYSLSLIVAVFFYNWNFLYSFEITYRAAIAFCALIFLFISPFHRKRPRIDTDLSPVNVNKINVVGKTVSVVLIFGCLLILPLVVRNMSMDFSTLREGDGMKFHTTFIDDVGIKILDILSPLSYYLLLTFFYLMVSIKGYKSLKFLLITASLSAPYYGILYGGRTQVIYWLLAFLFCFFLFRPCMQEQTKRKIIGVSIILFIAIFSYLTISTISRFADTKYTTGGSLLIYVGQPFLFFSDFFETYTHNRLELGRIFPFTSYIVNGPFDLEQYRQEIMNSSGKDIGIFYTFLGDLFVDVGMVGLVCYLLVYNFFSRKLLKKNVLNYPRLLILNALFLMPLHGLFYYSYWKMQVSFCLILVLYFCSTFNKRHELQS